jgi:hypothetical protein
MSTRLPVGNLSRPGRSSRARASGLLSLGDADRSVSSVLGEAWARDVAEALRAQTRDVVGGWPGTIREARSRVLLGMRAGRRPGLDTAEIEALSRAVYDAARRCWDQISEPDPEP